MTSGSGRVGRVIVADDQGCGGLRPDGHGVEYAIHVVVDADSFDDVRRSVKLVKDRVTSEISQKGRGDRRRM